MEKSLLDAINLDLNYISDFVATGNYQVHPYISRYREVEGVSMQSLRGDYIDFCDNARSNLAPHELGVDIARLTHRMWLTDNIHPHEADTKFLSATVYAWKNSFSGNWSHKFWVMDKNKLPETVDFLSASFPDVEFLNPDDHLSHGPWRTVFDLFMKHSKFTAASDVLRLQILHEYGGLYTDLGISFKFPVVDLFDKFDYAMIFWDSMFLQNSLMYMKKNNLITARYQEYYDSGQFDTRYLPSISGESEMLLFSGPHITVELLKILDGIKVLPLAANKSFVSWMAQQSWYTKTEDGRGKYGNAYMPDAKPSILQI